LEDGMNDMNDNDNTNNAIDHDIVTVTCGTRESAGAEQVSTELILDFGGVSRAQLIELAVKSAVIMWQVRARKEGIPATETVAVSSLLGRQRGPRGPHKPKLSDMTLDQLEALEAQLEAMLAARRAA
jgi:hypothetical protein